MTKTDFLNTVVHGYIKKDLGDIKTYLPKRPGEAGNNNFSIALCVLSYMEYLGSFFKTSSSRNPITEDLGCIDFKLNENIESISLYFRYVDYVIDNLGGCVLSLEVYPEDKREDISKENNPSKENNLPNEKNTENTTSGKIYFRLKTFQYVPIKISCAHASATLNLGNVIMDCSIVDGQESMDKTKRCISNRFSLVQQFKEKDRHPEILEIYRSK